VPQSHARVSVIGGGIAGTEAALQLADRGVDVELLEMRPAVRGPAHHTDLLAELVCSNSLKSDDPVTAAGALKRELAAYGSRVLHAARQHSVAAGGALAVDRIAFSTELTRMVESHPNITLTRREVRELPAGWVIIATGPLTSSTFEPVLTEIVGETRLAFFDAAAPIVDARTLDRSVIFPASRYDKGEGSDYLNAPLNRGEYERFLDALVSARRVISKDFERRELFAACQPLEEVARTGRDALRFGALKPVGLVDPRTGERPWAVVQLRAENRAATAYNLVGFQTNLAWPEQARVFRMIPGLQDAEFFRYGVMHRNTFVDAPRVLEPSFAVRGIQTVSIAGQLCGTEGYLEAAATGLLAGINVYAAMNRLDVFVPPPESVLGALVAYATDPDTTPYQPMHVNYGIVPPLAPPVRRKRERYEAYSTRGIAAAHDARRARLDLFGAGEG